jgi:hypothetical protein
MKIDIKLKQTEYLNSNNLNDLKLSYENEPLDVDGIYFDVDSLSLQRLKMLSNIEGEIEFKDANNNVLSLSGSELNIYLPKIENELGKRYNRINFIYNIYKDKLGQNESITYYNGVSGFFEYVHQTSFTQNDFDNI